MRIRGVVRGGTILLEEALPDFEGRTVSLDIEPATAAETSPTAAELEAAWRAWSTAPDAGPIAADDDAWP